MPAAFRFLIAVIAAVAAAGTLCAQPVPVPKDLPKYQLELELDTNAQVAKFRQTVTWTNLTKRPTKTIEINFFPNFRIPKSEYLLLAKTLELLRLNPAYGIDVKGRHGTIDSATLGTPTGQPLAYYYSESNPTTLNLELPREIGAGESITFVLDGKICLPNKQGRWGHWKGITYLTNALPVVAFYDEAGWHDTKFVPWHQPFWNEAGLYTATITLPADQTLACSAGVAKEEPMGDGRKRLTMHPFVGRDFAVTCSNLYREFQSTTTLADGRVIALKCYAYERHAFYAQEMLKIVAEAIPVYSEWFGAFPYNQFTIAESYFGWNGNEVGGMILIDERVFDMPHLARGYVEYLVSHETCHQWWYNQIGTNGYSETFLDEGAATFFTHRLLDQKRGKNNKLLEWPRGNEYLPNIQRDDYRWASLHGAIRRDDAPAAAGDLPEFENLVRLFSGAYDRGSKVFGMIEARLGAEFLPFIRQLVRKHSFRVLSAKAFKGELTAFVGPQSAGQWDDLFAKWVYGKGIVDYKIESVRVLDGGPRLKKVEALASATGPVRVEVRIIQKRELDEPTELAFRFSGETGYQLRVPIGAPGLPQISDDCNLEIESVGSRCTVVRVTLPARPTQITVDPDRILIDANWTDNSWKHDPKIRILPLYTLLSDTDLTSDYDRLNLTAGPWIWGPSYQDPWYTRSTMLGVRAGAYRTQTLYAGTYAAFRTDYRDLVAGVDGLLDHFPFPKTQIGFNYEYRLGGPYFGGGAEERTQRATVFARYVLQYTSSLYLPPLSYIEAFSTYQDNFLPFAQGPAPDTIRPTRTFLNGLHFRLNLYTPYWDAERGVWVDLVAAGGTTDLGAEVGTYQLRGELAAVRKFPDGHGYLSRIRAAGRILSEGAGPDQGLYFTLGGGTRFRGFDLAERQGSFLWLANGELRFPVAWDLEKNYLDRIIGLRNVNVVSFYDVGNIYANGRSVGGAAHALGLGLRLDIAFFSFIERATLRFDAAKTVNAATPIQFWFGFQHAF